MVLPKIDTLNGYFNPNKVAASVLSKRRTPHQMRVDQMMLMIRELKGNMPDLPSTPIVPPRTMILKQLKLILEETMEVIEACGYELRITSEAVNLRADCEYGDHLQTLLKYDELELVAAFDDNVHVEHVHNGIPHIAKELADLSVVTTGMFSELGISDLAVLEEVDANNLSKFAPGAYVDENHKLRKPPTYQPADINSVLVSQGWTQLEVCREEQTNEVPVSR